MCGFSKEYTSKPTKEKANTANKGVVGENRKIPHAWEKKA